MKSSKNQLNLEVVGYRSQLHDRGKGKTKSDVVTFDPAEKRTKQKELKQASHTNRGKGSKPSRVAAKFNRKFPDNSKEHTESNDRPRHKVQKSGNTGSASANEVPAAIVTKKDLKKLLETLNESDADDVSAMQKEANLGSQGTSSKISHVTQTSTKPDGRTEEMNINEKASEKPNEKLEDIAPVVKENSPEDTATSTTGRETIKPAAMRSSFAIGAPGLVTNNPHDDKAAKHKQWVKELEQQIREKKEREMKMKRDEYVDNTHRPIETKREGNLVNKQTNSSHSLKTTPVVTQFPQETDRSSTGHARGRGLMNMLSESEADKQRKKIAEHQKAIEVQVEDRRREKMKERERRLREEAIEDERVAKEREKLQKQFEEEMAKVKEKEEQAKRRAQVMQEGISKAFESAQQLKRDKRKNRLQGSTTEVMKFSHEDKIQNGKDSIVPDDSSKHQAKDNQHVVPPLDLRTSISPVNKSNVNISSRFSDPTLNVKPDLTLNVKRNSLIPVRDVKTSFSESDKDKSETLINKWVNEDFGCPVANREQNYDGRSEVNLSREVLVPFHRTASATLFRESLASQEVHESKNVNDECPDTITGNLTDRKVAKKGLPTKTSQLREKGTDSKNLSLTSRRKKNGDARPQQPVKKSKPHSSSQETSNEQVTNKYNGKSSIGLGNETTNIPSHLLATFTPTAHQEKILEQLSALRKGLLMKDQEIKTRVFKINDYEVQA